MSDIGGMNYDDQLGFLLDLYSMGGSGVPGNTVSQRLNLLQDIFGSAGISFRPDTTFIPEPMFEVNPETGLPITATESIYAQDPVWAGVFDQIDSGATPEAALRAAINGDLFEGLDKNNDRMVQDYMDIAKNYAKERFESMADFRRYQQDVAKAESERPLSLQEVMNPPSTYDRITSGLAAAGLASPEGVTGEDLARIYAQQNPEAIKMPLLRQVPGRGRTLQQVMAGAPMPQRASRGQQAAGPTFTGQPTTSTSSTGMSAQTSPMPPKKSAASSFAEGQKASEEVLSPWEKRYQEAYARASERRLNRARRNPAPGGRAQEALQSALLMALLSR